MAQSNLSFSVVRVYETRLIPLVHPVVKVPEKRRQIGPKYGPKVTYSFGPAWVYENLVNESLKVSHVAILGLVDDATYY